MPAARSCPCTWDIFCRVVDNFGDAGICWRLALILRREHGLHVRLWIDDLQTLRALHPAVDPGAPVQQVEGITVCFLQDPLPLADDVAVVIEAFGCGLPEAYVAGMAASVHPPLWIVLEYLSAEPWVDSHHGLSSPHPQLSLPRYFFFPGFTSATGGLLREADLLARRDGYNATARQGFWRELGFAAPGAATLAVSLFTYADAPICGLLAAMAQDQAPVVVAVPAGASLPAVRAFFGGAADTGAGPWRRDALEVRVLPFLPQARYDELLWTCDLNVVRGEDSFVRAQWAARPLVWQPYRQEAGAHVPKLEAFLGRYCSGLAPAAADALGAFWRCWNDNNAAGCGNTWPSLRAMLPDLAVHAGRWAGNLANSGEMAAQLVEFVGDRVE
jgi:uncharacterized repeat protein (TIGR03837 family)